MISQAARYHGNVAGAVVVGVVLCACTSQQTYELPRDTGAAPVTERAEQRRLTVGERAAIAAVRQIGVPYRYGGNAPDGFDCSGLVHYAYAKAGRRIPRTTRAQWRELAPVDRSDLRVGDLLFFTIDGGVSHVGMYLGSRRFVHAPSTGQEVTISELDSDYYRRTFVRGGRP